MGDLVEKVEKEIAAVAVDSEGLNYRAMSRAAIAVVLRTANEWMKQHDYTFCTWTNDTGKDLSDYARENGIELSE